ncbi:hypothetical protein QP858_07860 [Trueperella bernardiae]|uniref:Uncharacterized protein n=1 Tax=Trueperella bernardiae TaxID=59561 RepID=A0AAW6ZKS8_9ACTO|nr:hypothetical protein [Micrococcus luteus]MDK8526528.1 hypothetical protein [Micrococcus luteus]MDK8602369.1 hypothetical protein [Trueperella bernardiae]
MAYAPQHVWLVDKRDGRKFRGPAHYADIFDYITVAPSQRAADTTRQVTEPAPATTEHRVTEPARTTTRKTKAEEATR